MESPPPKAGETLTRRERDILRLVAEGLSNQQIARRLDVAVTTVRTHLHSPLRKATGEEPGGAGALRLASRRRAAVTYASGCLLPKGFVGSSIQQK